ncbi:MAG TPA: FHA domain-containing protein [Anaerolineales bacterium]|nr:FHA domain-containing protein [Anaerolineales bacterium]
MYSLTITNPNSEPLQIKLTSGKMVIGRAVTCDIVINDSAASRRHAEIFYDSITEMVTINDLRSSNGTYVNRQRITRLSRLQNGDVIRIGQTVMHLTKITNAPTDQKGVSGTRLFTRELVLEAVDEHPIPLNEITEKLNTVVDIDSAISLVIDLIKRTMGVDVCEIILAQNFNKINMEDADNLMVRAIRDSSVEASPLALCVPVISGGKPFALIYLEKTRPESHPFDKREMQLAVGISHQTALTLQRIELLERIRREGQVKQLLLRFVSPIEAEDVLKDYLKTGNLPDLAEKKVTVLFVEIADSTELAERLGSKKFSDFLNSFYQFATQVVFKNGGVVKYLGDGVLAVFMEAKTQLGPEERAAMVARDIIEFVKKANSPEPERAWVVGIAINTGKALVGYVGTQERAEFNVMGNLIKMTYRMQEYAIPNRIFVGASTAEAIRNKYLVQKAGNLAMRGSDQPIQVFEVSYVKTAPFVHTDKDGEMSTAFKAIAEKMKLLGK